VSRATTRFHLGVSIHMKNSPSIGAIKLVCFACLLLMTAATAVAAGPTKRVSVINAGIGSQNSLQGRERFVRDVVAVHPKYVLIYFGMNDTSNEPRFLSQEQFIGNIKWMVRTARRNRIVPILSTIQHVDVERLMKRHRASSFGAEGPNGKIDRYNSALRTLALKKKIALLDFTKVLDDAGGPTIAISTDGVHLTADGYRLLASSFLHAIPGPILPGDVIVCIGDSLTYGTPLRTEDQESNQTYPAQLERMANDPLAGH
jgi:lysophospholipase L1-like esterase